MAKQSSDAVGATSTSSARKAKLAHGRLQCQIIPGRPLKNRIFFRYGSPIKNRGPKGPTWVSNRDPKIGNLKKSNFEFLHEVLDLRCFANLKQIS